MDNISLYRGACPGDTWLCLEVFLVVTTRDEGAPGTQGEGAKDAAPYTALVSQAQRKICPKGQQC